MFRIGIATVCLAGLIGIAAYREARSVAAEGPIDPTIISAADKYLKAVLVGDASAASAMFREDATLMPAEAPLIQGRPAIEQYYRQWLNSAAKPASFTFHHLDAPSFGDTGLDIGTFRQGLQLPGGSNVQITGKYSVVVKRTGGQWKMAYLIFNTDRPSQLPPSVVSH